jgi:TonB family protein
MRYSIESALTEELLEGRYRVVRRIATGGMATVYAAEHALIGRSFAIKVLHPQYAEDAECVQRFLAEGRTAGTLGHPNIVESTDMGYTSGGAPFLVLELLEGMNLQEHVRRQGPLSIDRALHIAQQIASALSAAHARGIIHRDLKSGNVFLVDRGEEGDLVKVLDFGISKFLEQRGNTQKDVLLGTPWFMSPEQINDPSSVDGRCDIYGLGVILYEMLTGEVPFANTPYPKLFGRILSEEPLPIEQLRPEIRPELAALIRRAMAKSLADRAQTMDELGADLAALSGRKLPEVPARPAPADPSVETPTSAQTRLAGGPLGGPLGTPAPTRHWTPRHGIPRHEPHPDPHAPLPRPPTGSVSGPAHRSRAGLIGVGSGAAAALIAAAVLHAAGVFGGDEPVANPQAARSAPVHASAQPAPPAVPPAGSGEAQPAGSGEAQPAGADSKTVESDVGIRDDELVPGMQTITGPSEDAETGEPIKLVIKSSARGARVTFRGETHRLPFRKRLARGAERELIEIGVPGRWSKRAWITLDRDQSLVVNPDRRSGSSRQAEPEPSDEVLPPDVASEEPAASEEEEEERDEPEERAEREERDARPARKAPEVPVRSEPAERAASKGPAPGTMDREATRVAVNRRLRELRTCFERGRMDNPQLAGRVLVRIGVAPSGRVTSAEIASGSLGSAVNTCIVALVKTWTLPAPAGGVATTITYPFTFQ